MEETPDLLTLHRASTEPADSCLGTACSRTSVRNAPPTPGSQTPASRAVRSESLLSESTALALATAGWADWDRPRDGVTGQEVHTWRKPGPTSRRQSTSCVFSGQNHAFAKLCCMSPAVALCCSEPRKMAPWRRRGGCPGVGPEPPVLGLWPAGLLGH